MRMSRTAYISVELEREASLAGLMPEELANGYYLSSGFNLELAWVKFSQPGRPRPGKISERPREIQTAVNIENLAMRTSTPGDPLIYDPAVTSEPGVAYAEVDDALGDSMRVDLNGPDKFTRKVVKGVAGRLEALARAQREADRAQATETLRPAIEAARRRIEAGETDEASLDASLDASLEDGVFGQLPRMIYVQDDGRICVSVGTVAPRPGNFSLIEGDERAIDEFIDIWGGDR
jgi:hypothetical protein